MSLMKSRTVTTLLALLLLSPAPVFANAGKILFSRGDVSATNESGDPRPLSQGDPVNEGDRITTGARSMAQIRLSDGALISLRSHSDYQIVAQKAEGDLLEQAGKLFSGWMRSVTGAIGEQNPDAVSQETPVATIGIRGTTFQVIHIPAGGHPDFPDTPPGTYIYLQEGAIETTGGAEVRFMEPGDVVYVPLDGGAPVPAPQWLHLFGGGDDDAGDDGDDFPDGDDRTTRDDLESTDALNDGLIGTFVGGGSDLVNAAGFGFLGFDYGYQSYAVGDTAMTFGGGSGADRTLIRLEYTDGGGSNWLVEATGSTPMDTGHVELSGGAGEINWGVWAMSDYTVTTDFSTGSVNGPWIYMAGSNAVPLADVPITGTFTYNYAGGTSLYSAFGGSPAMEITGGSIDVLFGDAAMTVNLQTTGQNYTGNGQITAFYNNAIFLTGDGANAGTGNIRGAFVGENAEGIISWVEICEGCDQPAAGTAAFAR